MNSVPFVAVAELIALPLSSTQPMHALDEEEPGALQRPAPQVFAGGQAVACTLCPVLEIPYVPAAQGTQSLKAVAPVVVLYDPAGQSVQSLAAVPPVQVLNFPIAQAVQTLVAVAG